MWSQSKCIKTHFSISLPPQYQSQAVVCISTPKMYLRSSYFLVTTKWLGLYSLGSCSLKVLLTSHSEKKCQLWPNAFQVPISTGNLVKNEIEWFLNAGKRSGPISMKVVGMMMMNLLKNYLRRARRLKLTLYDDKLMLSQLPCQRHLNA